MEALEASLRTCGLSLDRWSVASHEVLDAALVRRRDHVAAETLAAQTGAEGSGKF